MIHSTASITVIWYYTPNEPLVVSWGENPEDQTVLTHLKESTNVIPLDEDDEFELTFGEQLPPIELQYHDDPDCSLVLVNAPEPPTWIQTGNFFRDGEFGPLFASQWMEDGIIIVGTIDFGGGKPDIV